jgi:hypothetical protein
LTYFCKLCDIISPIFFPSDRTVLRAYFFERTLRKSNCDSSPPRSARSRSGASSGPRWASACPVILPIPAAGGAPFWCGGGSPRSWGCGGCQPPQYPLNITRIFRPDPEISRKVRITKRRFRRISGSAVKDYLKNPVHDPAISKKDRPRPLSSKKIGHPPSPCFTLRKKTGRTDRFQNRSGRPHLFQCPNIRFHWSF